MCIKYIENATCEVSLPTLLSHVLEQLNKLAKNYAYKYFVIFFSILCFGHHSKLNEEVKHIGPKVQHMIDLV